MTAADMLNSLHDSYEYTDTELAEALSVSREYVSRLRHSLHVPSETLAESIDTLYKDILLEDDPVDYDTYLYNKEQREAEKAPILPFIDFKLIGVVGVVLLIVVCLFIAVHAQNKYVLANKKTTPQTTNTTTNTHVQQFTVSPFVYDVSPYRQDTLYF